MKITQKRHCPEFDFLHKKLISVFIIYTGNFETPDRVAKKEYLKSRIELLNSGVVASQKPNSVRE